MTERSGSSSIGHMEENQSRLRIRIKCLKKAPSLVDSSGGCETAHGEGKPSFNAHADEIANVECPKSATPTCPECGKTFRSDKSLFGHLRCHPERSYRGANPPPMVTKKRQLSEARDSAATPQLSAPEWPTAKRGRTWPDYNEDGIEDAAAVAAHILMLMSRAELVVIGNGLKTSEGKRTANKKEKLEELELVSTEPGTCSRRYECSVCLKSFASHQALGGHKASHRKNKIKNPKEEIKVILDLINESASKSNSPDACGSEYQKEATHDPSPSAQSSDQPDHKEASCRLYDFDLNEIPYPEEGEES